jgi:hypothetical protein
MALPPPTEEERVALAEWLTANDVNPETVPLHSRLSVLEDNGAKVIHYEEYVLTDDGHKQIDPEDNDYAWVRNATAPCKVDPPAWLHIAGTA